MSTYCIGDLHGREDLFFMLLDKINFNKKTDKLYVLGDVINKNYGGIKIIKYLMDNKTACMLLWGNHEDFFLYNRSKYDCFMFNESLKNGFNKVIEVYTDLYKEIGNDLFSQVEHKGIGALADKKIQEWINTGNKKVRETLLETMVEFIMLIECDLDIYKNAMFILSNMNGKYKTKSFVKELFEQTTEDYIKIIDYLQNVPKKVFLDIRDRKIVLMHSIRQMDDKRYYSNDYIFHHAKTQNTMYVYGHEPIPKIHKNIYNEDYRHCGYQFNYCEVFTYIDDNDNCYYNLDLGSNPVVALCLENMNEYYVGITPVRNSSSSRWNIPKNKTTIEQKRIEKVEKAYFCIDNHKKNITIFCENGRDSVYLTYRKGCQEYLIGIYEKKRQIIYTRVDLLDYRYAFVIDGWYEGQSLDEILEKVINDYNIHLQKRQLKELYKILQGYVMEK